MWNQTKTNHKTFNSDVIKVLPNVSLLKMYKKFPSPRVYMYVYYNLLLWLRKKKNCFHFEKLIRSSSLKDFHSGDVIDNYNS